MYKVVIVSNCELKCSTAGTIEIRLLKHLIFDAPQITAPMLFHLLLRIYKKTNYFWNVFKMYNNFLFNDSNFFFQKRNTLVVKTAPCKKSQEIVVNCQKYFVV